jgi:Phospholipase_D-nuclease N-terminal
MARTMVVLGGVLIVLVLDIVASVRVGRCDAVTSAQKAAWLVFIWFVPLLGSLLAFQITAEATGPPTRQSSGVGLGDPAGLDVGSHGGHDFGGDGHGH